LWLFLATKKPYNALRYNHKRLDLLHKTAFGQI